MQQAISTPKINLSSHHSYAHQISVQSLMTKFITWCDMQESKRFLWLGISLMGGMATVLPLTLIAIVFGANNNFNLWVITCSINVLILIANLAAQPTKVVLPVLFFAWTVDAIIITYCLVNLFA